VSNIPVGLGGGYVAGDAYEIAKLVTEQSISCSRRTPSTVFPIDPDETWALINRNSNA